jgi:hypothetical protein
MDPHRLRCRSLDQHAEERPVIGFVEEDRGPVDTAQNGVQRKAGCDDADESGCMATTGLPPQRPSAKGQRPEQSDRALRRRLAYLWA